MLRFPNPGSNFESFINVFKNINDKLSNYIFNLDDMVSVTIEKNLTSSSGYTGSQAIHHLISFPIVRSNEFSGKKFV